MRKKFISRAVRMKYIPTSRDLSNLDYDASLKTCFNWFIGNNILLHESIFLEFPENKHLILIMY